MNFAGPRELCIRVIVNTYSGVQFGISDHVEPKSTVGPLELSNAAGVPYSVFALADACTIGSCKSKFELLMKPQDSFVIRFF